MLEFIGTIEAARILGVTAYKLRVLDDDLTLSAYKTKGGHRRYRRERIEAIRETGTCEDIDASEIDASEIARNKWLALGEQLKDMHDLYAKLMNIAGS
ncbi:MAG: hypothetical protein JWN86_1753 [Planctomycetota bacterium]|nr:hypothetical protein [Planctomycetota bacterium]